MTIFRLDRLHNFFFMCQMRKSIIPIYYIWKQGEIILLLPIVMCEPIYFIYLWHVTFTLFSDVVSKVVDVFGYMFRCFCISDLSWGYFFFIGLWLSLTLDSFLKLVVHTSKDLYFLNKTFLIQTRMVYKLLSSKLSHKMG